MIFENKAFQLQILGRIGTAVGVFSCERVCCLLLLCCAVLCCVLLILLISLQTW
jgi:hypothetical protein